MKKITFLITLSFIVFAFANAQTAYYGERMNTKTEERNQQNRPAELVNPVFTSVNNSINQKVIKRPSPAQRIPLDAEKHVVLEEGTGTWCSWCPSGTYYGDSLTYTYDNVIVIAVHGYDDMENTPHMEGAGIEAYPSANINRVVIGSSIFDWFNEVEDIMMETPEAGIEVDVTFNETTRELSAEITASFQTDVSGDYRLGAVILENCVTGPSPDFDQSNSYSGGSNGWMGGFESLPGTIPANMIAYNHVSRQLLGGYDGEPGSLPSSISSGEMHSFTFTYTLPELWDEDNVYVAGWLIAPDGSIENANKSVYLSGTTNAKPQFLSTPIDVSYVETDYLYAIYTHDPDNSSLDINATQLPSWLTLSETNDLGHIHNYATLSGTPETAGEYEVTLEINDGEWVVEQSFTIFVESALSGVWELVGEASFTTTDSYNQDFEVDENGTCYLITNEDEFLEVYKREEDENWTGMGLNVVGSFGQIEIASDGTPFIAYSDDSGIRVKKYENGNWLAIGSSPTNGVQIGLALDSQDMPYICCQDFDNGYEGRAYKYDGNSWVVIGGVPYSGSGMPGVWNQIIIDDTDNVYVLWADWNAGSYANVSKYDGSAWSLVGESIVSDKVVYYYQSFTMDNDGNIYVSFPDANGHTLESFIYDGGTWSSIGSNLTGGAVGYCDMAISQTGIPFVTFLDISYSNTISTMSYDGLEWNFVGPRGFTGTKGSYPKIAVFDDMPYVCYADISINGDKATTKRYYEEITGVGSFITSAVGIYLHPNPARDMVNISSDMEIKKLEVYDYLGQLSYKSVIRSKSTFLNVSGLTPGLYFIKFYTIEGTVVKRMVIN